MKRGKYNYDLIKKKKSSIRFITDYKFNQIRRNDDRQSCQLSVTFRGKMDCAATLEKRHLIHFRLNL